MSGRKGDVVCLSDEKTQTKAYKHPLDLSLESNYKIADLLNDFRTLRASLEDKEIQLDEELDNIFSIIEEKMKIQEKQEKALNNMLRHVKKYYDARITNLEYAVKNLGGKI